MVVATEVVEDLRGKDCLSLWSEFSAVKRVAVVMGHSSFVLFQKSQSQKQSADLRNISGGRRTGEGEKAFKFLS